MIQAARVHKYGGNTWKGADTGTMWPKSKQEIIQIASSSQKALTTQAIGNQALQ